MMASCYLVDAARASSRAEMTELLKSEDSSSSLLHKKVFALKRALPHFTDDLCRSQVSTFVVAQLTISLQFSDLQSVHWAWGLWSRKLEDPDLVISPCFVTSLGCPISIFVSLSPRYDWKHHQDP